MPFSFALRKTHHEIDRSALPPLRQRHPLNLPLSERRLLLFLCDTVALVISVAIATSVQNSLQPRFGTTPEQYRWLTLLSVGWLASAALAGCYRLERIRRPLQSFADLLPVVCALALAYLAVFFLWRRPADLPDVVAATMPVRSLLGPPPRLLPFLLLFTNFFAGSLARLACVHAFRSQFGRRRLLILGAGRAGRAFAEAMQSVRDYQIVGYIDDDPALIGTQVSKLQVLGGHVDLLEIVRSRRVHELALAIVDDLDNGFTAAILTCHERGINTRAMAAVYEEVFERIPVEHLRHAALLQPGGTPMPTCYRLAKRGFDIVAALVGLSFTAVICPAVGLAIWLDSPGGVFYSQQRLGKSGCPFTLWKFRSMIKHAEQDGEARWSGRNDQRITRVGRWLRRSRLDELPQLWSVLRGDMSIVGPRPERPQFVADLQQTIPFYRARLSVKPGLTGWAQIKFGYGQSAAEACTKLQYDLYYLKRRSILLDLVIMIRTIRVVLGLHGT